MIRQYFFSDRRFFLQMGEEYCTEIGRPFNADTCGAYIDKIAQEGEVFVYEDAFHQPVGLIGIIETTIPFTGEAVIFQSDLYVATSFRHQGVGKALIEYAKAIAKSLGKEYWSGK